MITTVIPTFKRAALLKGAIQSALNQTHRNIQVCVYDNSSRDETADLVQQIAIQDARVHYYCQEKPVGAAENFQFGLSRVNSPFFSILADDDLLAPHFYETALAYLNRFPSASFFLGSTLDVNPKGKIISASADRWTDSKLYSPPFGLFQTIASYFNWTGAVFRSDLLKTLTLDCTVKAIDLDFLLRLSAQFPFIVSQVPCALFIHHKTSYSSQSGLKLVWPSWNKIMQNIDSLESLSFVHKVVAKNLLHKRLKKTLFSITIHSILDQKFEQAIATLDILVQIFPADRKGRIFRRFIARLQKKGILFHLFKISIPTCFWVKTIYLQYQYGRFAKTLINQYHGIRS